MTLLLPLRRRVLAAGILSLLLVGGCDDPTRTAVTAVEVAAPSDVVVLGRSLQLTASLRGATGDPRDAPVTWSSSDPAVASVDPGGVVRGASPGRVRITARSGRAAGQVELTVTRVASFTLRIQTDSLFAGGRYGVVAEVRDTAGRLLPDVVVTWTTSDTLVVRITPPAGPYLPATITAVAPGTVTVAAETEGVRATVRSAVYPGERVVVNPYWASPPYSPVVAIGGTRKLLVSLVDVSSREVAPRPLTWSSSDPSVISVDSAGVIRGLAPGAATITASAAGARSGSLLVYAERGFSATSLPIEPYDINEHGQVAGAEYVPGVGRRPAIWEGGKITWSGDLVDVSGMVINDSGYVAGTWARRTGEPTRGFVWKGGTLFRIAPPDSAAFLVVTGMNLRGQVVGYWTSRGDPARGNAFVWEDGALRDLGRFGGDRAEANGIDDRGNILVTVWPQGRVKLVGSGGETDVAAGQGVYLSPTGDLVVQQGANALVRHDGRFIEFVAGHRATFDVMQVNVRGEVVGDYTSGGFQAFLRRGERFFNPQNLTVDGPDYGYSRAVAINDAGQVLARADRWLLLTPLR